MGTSTAPVRNLRGQTGRIKRSPGSPSGPRALAQAEARTREIEVLRYRMRGYTFDQIATVMGFTIPIIYKIYHRAMDRQVSPMVETLRKEQDLRLTGMLQSWWPYAVGEFDTFTGKPKRVPDIKAAELVLKIEAQRASLWGANAPTKIASTTPDGKENSTLTISFGEDPKAARKGMSELVKAISGQPMPEGLDDFDTDAGNYAGEALPDSRALEAGIDQD